MLYLIDLPMAKLGLDLAQRSKEAKVVLIQDGVYVNTSKLPKKIKVYAIKDDVENRAVQSKLAKNVETIGYDKLVDLIVENKVANFA